MAAEDWRPHDKEIAARRHFEEENLQLSASQTDLEINDALKALLKDKIEQAQALGKEAKDLLNLYSIRSYPLKKGFSSVFKVYWQHQSCSGVLRECLVITHSTLLQALQLKAEIDAAGCSKFWKRTFADSKLEGLSASFSPSHQLSSHLFPSAQNLSVHQRAVQTVSPQCFPWRNPIGHWEPDSYIYKLKM